MIAIGFMRDLWRKAFKDVRIIWVICFLPSIIVMYSLLAVIAVFEFVFLDLLWLLLATIEDHGRLKANIWYLTH